MITINYTNQYQPAFSLSFSCKKPILSNKIAKNNRIEALKNKQIFQNGFEKLKFHLKEYFHDYINRINYIAQHKKAFLKIEKELTGKNTLYGYFHDTDKLLMYIIGIPKKKVHNIHVATALHHIRNGHAKKPIQTVIDWECARYTKPDKPFSAREFYELYYVKKCNMRIPEIEQALEKLGL